MSWALQWDHSQNIHPRSAYISSSLPICRMVSVWGGGGTGLFYDQGHLSSHWSEQREISEGGWEENLSLLVKCQYHQAVTSTGKISLPGSIHRSGRDPDNIVMNWTLQAQLLLAKCFSLSLYFHLTVKTSPWGVAGVIILITSYFAGEKRDFTMLLPTVL